MIHTLGHVGLCVKDVERSLEFYRDFMGMEVLMDLDVSDDRMVRLLGTPGVSCRIVHLKLGTGVLELFQFHHPEGEDKSRTMRQYDRGIIHIGFEINDFHKHVEFLKKKGVEFLGESVEFRPGVWVAYFRGPDGEVCELREQPIESTTAQVI